MNTFKIVLCMIMALGALASCQQNETVSISDECLLGIRASVSNPQVSRTMTEGETTTFCDGDRIGLFMPDADSPTLWIRESGNWNTDSPSYWPDLISKFDFDAFYPYEEGMLASRNSIPMPDISLQTGAVENLGKYDFLVAHTSVDYVTSQNGMVSFTGSSAFQHKYCLIKLVLKNGNDDDLSLNRLTLSGTDIMSKCIYDMAAGQIQKKAEEASINELVIEGNSTMIPSSGHTLAILINPSIAEQDLTFSLSYVRGKKNYTASTEITDQFESGKLYQYTVTIRKEGLALEIGGIADWNTGEILDDIVVKDEAVGA